MKLLCNRLRNYFFNLFILITQFNHYLLYMNEKLTANTEFYVLHIQMN
jgi:hypothetical protein